MKTSFVLRQAAVAVRVATHDAHAAALANVEPWHAYTEALRQQCLAEAELEAAGLTLHEPPPGLGDEPEHIEYVLYHGAVDVSVEVSRG
jgi:uncharacterized protein YggE